MKFLNSTPFAVFVFESLDLHNERFQVIVVKGTYDIIPSGTLTLSKVQEPVRTAEELYDSKSPSSLRYEDDLAPLKLCTDVLITATAHAPGATPTREWLVSISLGCISKQLLVTGPRAWSHAAFLGWRLSAPEPVLAVPIRYEHAFGGAVKRADGQVEVFAANPVGRGSVDPSNLDRSVPIPAPVILAPDRPLPDLGVDYPVEGFSPIHKSWLPRRANAGTYDQNWVTQRPSQLPEDFDFAFYNAAHPDLLYPGYVVGGESVHLNNLCEDYPDVRFTLPAQVVGIAITDKVGYRYGTAARLDTVHIDAERMKVHLVRRATLPIYRDGVARIEAVVTDSIAAKVAQARDGGPQVRGVS